MEKKLLSYTLSRLEIYFITCIYRTNVAFYVKVPVRESDPYACMRCVGIREVVCMLCLAKIIVFRVNERGTRRRSGEQLCKG